MALLLNVLLFILKFIAGKISGSVSIIADAFNNLTDAGTVLLSLIGVQISAIGPGKNHPDGHGKFEWVFALITSLSVLLVGWELIRDSIESIKNPADTMFSWITLIILILSISIKIFLYFYNMNKSREKNLLSLKAVAIDSISDAFSTTAVLLSLLLNTLFGLHIDGFFGAAVSVLIMYNAIKSACESINSIVGTAVSEDKLNEVLSTIKSFVDGDVQIIDLEITDYGYNRHTVSFHLLSTDQVSADEILLIVPILQIELKTKFGYNSMIQVEKSTDKITSDKIINNAQICIEKAGLSYKLIDSRVLICKNNTYQLVSSIITPWLEKEKVNQLNNYIANPESFGLNPNDSVLIKIILSGHGEERYMWHRHDERMKKQLGNK